MSTRHPAIAPELALATLRQLPQNTPVIVDLDETLLLEGSCERFLDLARPSLIARLVLLFLDVLKPWRWMQGARQRDYVRVRVISLLLPWIWARWRRAAPDIARKHVNAPLLAALAHRPVLVATYSFHGIAEPLVNALLPEAELLACALNRRDRAADKVDLLREQHPAFPVQSAAFITDSDDDDALLGESAQPLKVIWPTASVAPALESVYLPLRYTETIRRKGQRFTLRCILQEDLAFFLVATLPLASNIPLTALGLSVLVVSFWCLYEQGYVDNDEMARRYEPDNPRPPTRKQLAYGRPYDQALICALVVGSLGCEVLALAQGVPVMTLLLPWLGLLMAVILCYAVYNRVNPDTRLWLFPGLQCLRIFGLCVVAPITTVGAVMLFCHLAMRHFEYYVYRRVEGEKANPPLFLLRLELFVFALLALVFVVKPQAPLPVEQWLPVLLWGIFRARKEISTAITQASFVSSGRKSS